MTDSPNSQATVGVRWSNQYLERFASDAIRQSDYCENPATRAYDAKSGQSMAQGLNCDQ